MNILYKKPAGTSSPRRFEDSARWGASWAAAHSNGKSADPSAPRRVITGEYLAKNHLDARERARLAADLIEGRADLGKLTAGQIIHICRSNAVYVADARRPAVVTLADATPEEIARELDAAKLWKALELATA